MIFFDLSTKIINKNVLNLNFYGQKFRLWRDSHYWGEMYLCFFYFLEGRLNCKFHGSMKNRMLKFEVFSM